MNEGKKPQDDLKTLEKFVKQLHMYAPDQLRNALKISIGIARGALEGGSTDAALLPEFDGEACMIIFPKDSGHQINPGDPVRIEVAGTDEGLIVYRAQVASVRGDWKEICLLRDFSMQTLERRGAKRFSVFTKAEYYPPEDGGKGVRAEIGVVLNFSETGLLLASSVPLELEKELTISFEMNWGAVSGTPVTIAGTIVREQDRREKSDQGTYPYSYGVKFKTPFKPA